eukprot:24874-Eustigmatos_ZCMA.PRE.1
MAKRSRYGAAHVPTPVPGKSSSIYTPMSNRVLALAARNALSSSSTFSIAATRRSRRWCLGYNVWSTPSPTTDTGLRRLLRMGSAF